jgi:hypothetical protein
MRPARQCRSLKASFATPAGKPIPKVGDAALTAVSTRCGLVRTDQSASTCSGNCRSSSSGQGRRMSVARVAVAADVLHGRMPGRNNRSASEAAMAVRNGRSVGVPSHSVLLSSSRGRRSSNRHRRKPRESGRDAVAAVVAAANQQNPARPTRTRRRNSRGRRASRVLRVRPRPRAPTPSLLARMAERRAPRATVPNGEDASGAVAVVGAVVADPRPRRHSFGCAALSVIGRFCRNAASLGTEIASNWIDTAPNRSKSLQIGSIPLQIGSKSHQIGSKSHQIGSIPHQIGPMPHQIDSIPHQIGSMPHQIDSMPHQIDSIPHQIGSMPHQIDSIPHQIGPMPHQIGSMPHQIDSMPHQIGSMPHQIGSIPLQIGSIPHRIGPIPQRLTDNPTTGQRGEAAVYASVAVAGAFGATFGRLSWRWRAVHSANPSQRMQ